MLQQACDKILRESVSHKACATLQNLEALAFADEAFDFVLCEDGPLSMCDAPKAIGELSRVLKPSGGIWASVVGRYVLALRRLRKDPEEAIALATGACNFTLPMLNARVAPGQFGRKAGAIVTVAAFCGVQL